MELEMLDLIRRIQNEEPLSPTDEARLDSLLLAQHDAMRACLAHLESVEPSPEWRLGLDARLRDSVVPALVRGLEDDVPSMAWRSALNDRLQAIRPKRRWTLGWNLAAIGGCAAAIAAVWVYQTRTPLPSPKPVDSIEAQLIAAHQDTARAIDLGVASLAPDAAGAGTPASPRWTEFDLEAL